MLSVDVLVLNNAFTDLLLLVRNQSQNYKGFKALCTIISPHLYQFVKEDLSRMMKDDVYSAKRLVQLFSYTSRLSLNDINLDQQCLDDYVAIEAAMPDSFPSSIVQSLNIIIKRWMKSFDSTLLRPQHGPGGVAGHGRTSLENKYKDLTSDVRLAYAFRDLQQPVGPIQSSLDRISQTIFVPKSYKTFRTISMESSTLQYYQQSIWKEIDRVVGSSRFLRSHIGFHDQTRNQRLAKEGSLYRSFATIDLSAASDSVSYRLVKDLFRGTPLLRFIVATRSDRTLLKDGRLIALKKFAPMGSALCFPIETLIFAAICQMVARRRGDLEEYSVFGDDIIVPTSHVGDVMSVLDQLGFSVNKQKSYYLPECWFRESCGAEYCDGFDVTPMRVSRKYTHKNDGVRLSGLIDLANEAYKRGFLHLRGYFLEKLKSSGFIAHFGPTGVHSDSSTNYHTKTRVSPHLHRLEAFVTTIASKQDEGEDDSIRLRYWLESTRDRTSVELAFSAKIGRPTSLLKNRWVWTVE